MNLFWLIGLVAFFFLIFRRIKIAKILAIFALAWLILISVFPIPNLLIRQLEKQNQMLDIASLEINKPVNILVLGAGHSYDSTLSNIAQLQSSTLFRLTEGMRIYYALKHKYPNLEVKLMTSGNSTSGRMPQAERVGRAAVELGVPPKDTLMQVHPFNTDAEAREYFDRFGNKKTLIVVTDASHMPRALKWFHKRGLQPIPAPGNYLVRIDPTVWTYNFWPSALKIKMMDIALHEYIGLILVNL